MKQTFVVLLLGLISISSFASNLSEPLPVNSVLSAAFSGTVEMNRYYETDGASCLLFPSGNVDNGKYSIRAHHAYPTKKTTHFQELQGNGTWQHITYSLLESDQVNGATITLKCIRKAVTIEGPVLPSIQDFQAMFDNKINLTLKTQSQPRPAVINL